MLYRVMLLLHVAPFVCSARLFPVVWDDAPLCHGPLICWPVWVIAVFAASRRAHAPLMLAVLLLQ